MPKADKTVVLTAVLTRRCNSHGDLYGNRKGASENGPRKADGGLDRLTEDLILNENTDRDHITKDLFLPTEGANGSSIVWESSEPEFVNEEGG